MVVEKKTACQHKHKVFFWLLLKDRLSTRDLLRRKGMELQSNECVLCTQHIDETLEHLFLLCPMAIQFWNSIGLIIPAFNTCTEVMMSFRRQFIFRNVQPTLQACQVTFRKEFALALHRAKNSHFDMMKEWIDIHL